MELSRARTNPQQFTRKRKRTCSNASLPTPPYLDLELEQTVTPICEKAAQAGSAVLEEEDAGEDVLETSLHVLRTEAAALANVTAVYASSTSVQSSLRSAVDAILAAQRTRNRLIVCGVGKSAFIAQKFVATCKSFSIPASFLHACEAVHGDLGDVRPGDVVMFVSYSGRTPELLNVLPHLPSDVGIIALTGQTKAEDCRLLDGQVANEQDGILLPAPIPESEERSFGVAAPTTSTTVALAVSDMLALTLVERMHGSRKKEVFGTNHPGGAIGMREVKRAKR